MYIYVTLITSTSNQLISGADLVGGAQGARAPRQFFQACPSRLLLKSTKNMNSIYPPTIFHFPRIYGTGDIFYTENKREYM